MIPPVEVIDVDGCSLTIESPDDSADDAVLRGAVVQIMATMWLGTRAQLDELIVSLVMYANEHDKREARAA